MKTFASATLAAAVAGRAMVGTNAGGWMVLEPWITPSLFYRFLGKTHSEGVGIDQWTFCEALGPEEGNKVLRDHWDSWYTEEMFAEMAEREVEIIRLPIGDWTLRQYGPYEGCTDGAADKVQWFLDMAAKYDIKVLMDVHCLKDSQNGYDNSGLANRTIWKDENNFNHWDQALGEWMGEWNLEEGKYNYIKWDNIQWALDNVSLLMDKWGHHPALYALEPVNEPWWSSDLYILKQFYRDARRLVQQKSHAWFVFHDAFHFGANDWNDMFDDDDMEMVAMDTHFYQAWWGKSTLDQYCSGYWSSLQGANDIKYPVWVGEWSLATDTCAMWLGGFNDSNAEYVFDCEWVDCPVSYLPEETAADFDRTAATLGPFGSSDRATVQYGKCARDSTYFSDEQVDQLGHCALDAFDDLVDAHFLWTFRNELEDKWSYKNAYDKGWIKHSTNEFLQ